MTTGEMRRATLSLCHLPNHTSYTFRVHLYFSNLLSLYMMISTGYRFTNEIITQQWSIWTVICWYIYSTSWFPRDKKRITCKLPVCYKVPSKRMDPIVLLNEVRYMTSSHILMHISILCVSWDDKNCDFLHRIFKIPGCSTHGNLQYFTYIIC